MSTGTSPYADTQSMYAVHGMFRRELGLLPGLVRLVSVRDQAHARIVADHIGLMLGFLHHHHSAEDAVLWPLLLARAPKDVDPVVQLVDGHHEKIGGLLTDAEAWLKVWSGGATPEDGDELALSLQRLFVAAYEHMGLEEKLVLPLVERHIFATEWTQMEHQALGSIGPETVVLAAGMIGYESGLDALPAEVREAVAESAPRAYESYARRVHGTPTPPRGTQLVIGTPYVGMP